MSVTERLMGVGSWRIKLRPDTPSQVMNKLHPRVSGFGHVVITPTWVDLADMTDAAALALARYTGIYQSQTEEFELGGMGVNGWMGNGSDRGYTVGASFSPGTGTFADWRNNLIPSYLTGGITSVISGTFTKVFTRTFFRNIIDEVSARFGAEWRVTNDFKLDFGLASALFQLTPVAVIVRHAADAGRDFNVAGINGDLSIDRDVNDWAWRVQYWWGGTPTLYTQNGAIADIDVPLRGPSGSPAYMEALVTDSQATFADAAAKSSTQFASINPVRQEITLDSIEYDIGRDVAVGDNVYVFDIERGIFDLANPVKYRGQTIYPEKIRCVGMTWPVRNGMGVWFRRYVKSGGSWVVEWFDLTPYVRWDSGETTVEVGAKPRS